MAKSREHLTALPSGFIVVRILQLLFTAATLSLSVFILTETPRPKPFVVVITAACTFPALIYIILATYTTPHIYNYWIILGLEILFFLAWADGLFFALGTGYNAGDGGCLTVWQESTQSWQLVCKTITNETLYRTASDCSLPLVGFAAGLSVLWLVSMIVVSVFVARHRRAAKAGEGPSG